jgi:hypothetical protein
MVMRTLLNFYCYKYIACPVKTKAFGASYFNNLALNGRGGARRPDHDQQHCYHQAPKVKPEAATAVELLMMGVRTPENVEL